MERGMTGAGDAVSARVGFRLAAWWRTTVVMALFAEFVHGRDEFVVDGRQRACPPFVFSQVCLYIILLGKLLERSAQLWQHVLVVDCPIVISPRVAIRVEVTLPTVAVDEFRRRHERGRGNDEHKREKEKR